MFQFLRKDLPLVLAVAAVFLALSYAIGYVTERPTTVESQPFFLEGDRAPKAQAAAGRVWKEYSFEKLLTLGPSAVTKPVIVRVADTGDIYTLDWADLRIKKLSPDGKLLRSFGDGKGTGAGAFTNPTSFSVTPGGELWVCDPLQRKLAHFEPNGTVDVVTPRDAVDRVAVLGDALVTMAPPGNNALFEVYSPSGKQLRSFGEFLQNQPEQGIILDGAIVGDADSGGFVYGGRHIGVIAGYGVDGGRRFVAHTIDDTPLPKVLNIDGRLKVKPTGAPSVMSLSIQGNYLYALSGTQAETTDGASVQVMDVYDKRDGNYLFSLKLPDTCIEAVVHADRIYVLNSEGITMWRFRQNA